MNAGGEIPLAQRPQHLRGTEKDHIPLGIAVITESFSGDDFKLLIFHAGNHIRPHQWSRIGRQDIDMDKALIAATASVTNRVFKTGGTVVIGPGPELDHASVSKPYLAVFGESGKALQEEHIAILIRVVR